MNIEDRMSMWAAKKPRDEVSELLLEGAQEIADLRRQCQVLSQKNHCPEPDNAANEDNYLAEIDRLKATITSLSGDRDLFKNLARQFGEDATRAKKRIEELESGLTDWEREAIKSAIWDYRQNDHDEDCARMVLTLESLLERME
jgi:outer membrane murein-binding lipoprotein Lpp